MSKSTDKIVNALERCYKGEGCRGCPYYVKSAECIRNLKKDSADLIILQEAMIELKTMDIESLTNERDMLEEMLGEQKAEIDRLKAKIKSLYKEIERIALMTVETDRKNVEDE